MWAITVKFLGPTNTKPSRWSVQANKKRREYSKGHFVGKSDDADARAAAEAFAAERGWTNDQGKYGKLIEGMLPDGVRVFVFDGKDWWLS